MGFFSPKKTVSVASVTYSLAGDIANRPDYLKNVVLGSVLSDQDRFIGEDIINTHLNGPGMDRRRFFNWATSNYNLGLPGTRILNTVQVDPTVVAGQITPPSGMTIHVQNAFIEAADIHYYAQQYIWANSPSLIDTNWTVDYDESTKEVVIQHADTSTVSFTQVMDKNDDLLIAYYNTRKNDYNISDVTGSVLGPIYVFGDLPDVTGYTTILSNDTPGSSTITETVHTLIEYSDATPDEESTVDDGGVSSGWTDNNSEYVLVVYQGADGVGERVTTDSTMVKTWTKHETIESVDVGVVVEDIGGGVTKTTTTTTTTESVRVYYEHQTNTATLSVNELSGDTEVLVYVMGSGGNAVFDALQSTASSPPEEFFPFIPLRLDGLPITDVSFDFYDDCDKAYKKATGAELSSLLESIDDNPDIDDIDYCFLVFGVSVNTTENTGLKYIYNFLKQLIPFQDTSVAEYAAFVANTAANTASDSAYNAWLSAQYDSEDVLFGEAMPTTFDLEKPKISTLITNSNDVRVPGFDQRLEWINIDETVHVGLGKVGAVKGDVWWEEGTPDTWIELVGGNDSGGTYTNNLSIENEITVCYLYFQTGTNEYKKLTVRGLTHINYVYKTKAVITTLADALNDTDESGFLVPLHSPTVRAMSLIDYTQLTLSDAYLVFNTYEVTKQKWYETNLFKIILVIVIIAATVVFAPAAGGILGLNASVGVSLGFTVGTTAALVAGAVANAIAAMIVTRVITSASVKLFGEKVGGVVGAIASFVVLNVGTNFMTEGTLGMNWGSMTRAENLLKLTSVSAKAYQNWVQADINEIFQKIDAMAEEYEDQSEEIQKLAEDLGLYNTSGINLGLMDSLNTGNDDLVLVESTASFIGRTTMVGSDIVELDHTLISDFADITTSLPNAI